MEVMLFLERILSFLGNVEKWLQFLRTYVVHDFRNIFQGLMVKAVKIVMVCRFFGGYRKE